MKRVASRLLLALPAGMALSLQLVARCYAADTSGPVMSSIGWLLFQVAVYLALIIGLFYTMIKLVAKRNRVMQTGRAVKTLGGAPLGPNKSVQVIEIGRSVYVIGVGEDVRLIDKVEDAEEIEYIRDHIGLRHSESIQGFSGLRRWLQRRLKRTGERVQVDDLTASFHQVFKEKMERVSVRNRKVDEWMNEQNQADRLHEEE